MNLAKNFLELSNVSRLSKLDILCNQLINGFKLKEIYFKNGQ